MITTRATLVEALQHYTSPYREEVLFIKQFNDLLEHEHAYLRTHLPGHITASGWIVNAKQDHVALVHHAKLNKWLQPGGHADGDEDILRVARKEIEEELGLQQLILMHTNIFDLDIHPIPARGEFPEHLHYDVRFLFQSNAEQLKISEESHAVRWIPFAEIEPITDRNSSIQRMVEKTIRFIAN